MDESLLQTLAPAAIKVQPGYIQIGERFARTVILATFPRYLNANWFSPVINFDRVMDISIYIAPRDTGDTLKKLRDQLARLQAQQMEDSSKGKVRDPKLEAAINDIENLRDRLQTGEERFFDMGIYITIFENSLKELDETEAKIKNMLDFQLIAVKPASFRMLEGFLTTVPLANDRLSIRSPFDTEPVSSVFPFVSADLTSNSGILYGINTHNNSLVLFDRFSLENSNAVVFAKSGAGKSYTVKLEILRQLVMGTQVFVIDPDNEYKHLCDAVGGTNVKISVTSDQHVNPFDLPVLTEGESPNDVLNSHILDLAGLMKLLLGDVTPEEDAILDQALIQTYAVKDITADRDFSNSTPPVLSDLQSILDGMAGADRMATRLRKFTEGTFAGFLNNPTNVPLDNQLVVFGLRDMEQELQPIAMYLVLNHMWTQIRRELKRRILAVDEAWRLMKFPVGADFLFNIAKRGRKYFVGLTTISQDIPDFLQSPQGKAILTNSSIQILMKQSPAAIDLIKDTFNLTDAEKYYLLEARVGYGLFFLGSSHVGIRVVASYAEDQLITSDPRQLLEIAAAKEELSRGETVTT